MTPFDFVLIACTIISTSFISGLFGMAGGMILVGVLLVYFDVATGMVIFSIIQFVANGWRAVLWGASSSGASFSFTWRAPSSRSPSCAMWRSFRARRRSTSGSA